MRLSICIPTYNRARHLANCLASLRAAGINECPDVEICVSDNASPDDTAEVVRNASRDLPIRYHRQETNVGIPRNFLTVVGMAEGEFVWLIGDDDLIVPGALPELLRTIAAHPGVDYFYVNAFHLTTEYVLSFPQPFSTADLPADMTPFSSWPADRTVSFHELIDPRVSFDFLGGMFLAVFRRRLWVDHAHVLDPQAIADSRTFSHFDNTFPHVRIFASAFAGSNAFFHAQPLIVCLTGAREWAPKFPLVRSVRLVEALQAYRAHGLPRWRYLWCMNFALRTFLPDLGYMAAHRATSGIEYIKPARLTLSHAFYPNLYLSVVYYVGRKMRQAAAALGESGRRPASAAR